jgi:hypothetical protein
MEPLGDVGHIKSRFGPFGDSVSVSARLVHILRQMYHRLSNNFGCTRWYSEVTRFKWKLVSVRLEIVLFLTQDRCMICAELFWTHPMELLGDVGHVESCFGLIGDEVSIVLDAPDGTAR